MANSISYPGVHAQENLKVTYEQRKFLGFKWYKRLSLEKIDVDVVIQMPERIGIILVNGIKYVPDSSTN